MPIRHILLTTDLSDEALRAFTPVETMARKLGAKITVFHMVPELRAVPHGAPLAPPVDPPDMGKMLDDARTRLGEQLAVIESDVEIHAEVVIGDNVWKEINEYVDKNKVDLIAMSTHGRTGFRRLVLGSVAETILRHSHVPVLAFPRQE